jgi:hypothetical protein
LFAGFGGENLEGERGIKDKSFTEFTEETEVESTEEERKVTGFAQCLLTASVKTFQEHRLKPMLPEDGNPRGYDSSRLCRIDWSGVHFYGTGGGA